MLWDSHLHCRCVWNKGRHRERSASSKNWAGFSLKAQASGAHFVMPCSDRSRTTMENAKCQMSQLIPAIIETNGRNSICSCSSSD